MRKAWYTDEELLALSGIQHICFCPRQWALIHVERQWEENLRTAEGRLVHQRVDDPFFTESRGDVVISRAFPLISYTLGLYGVADVVEYIRSEDGVSLPGREGLWAMRPVEYNEENRRSTSATRSTAVRPGDLPRRCSAFGLNGATSTTMRSAGCRSCCLPNCESGFARCRRRCTISLQRVSLPPPMPPGSATSVPSRISACRS